MDFALTDEQRQFRDSVRAFVDKEIIPVARDAEHSGRYPTEIVETMKGLGFFGALIPDEYGGMDVDFVSYSLLFEEIARGWMGIAGILGSHTLATWMINRHGTEDQRRRYLPELATGARRTGIALTEPDAGSDLQGITTRARRDGDHYIVTGTKTWITNARFADPLPVLVKTDPKADPAHRGMSILLVDAASPGYEVARDLPKLGYKGPESCEVTLDEVRVPAANLLGGTEGRGLQQALSALEVGRINVAARSLGIAQRSYDESLAYSRERRTFGKPIAEHQAIQLKLADMATTLQAARLLVRWAAVAKDDTDRADLETGMAKLFASEVAVTAAQDAMRIHGGYGYSQEYEVERLFRDSMLMSIGEGTSDILRTVIAKAVVSGRGKVT
ncbi:acyl-CoA dehydrogenase family protein [Actinomadura rugatobispora]|uniref:Acyl-CoA dehydrogenase family protein n=1 Tax=Actinomadura rugatobispora TaxID=1994 RepID=A0ABW1A223_9ACTN|nr:acyl-CoA dehydrogenase family protein [Actinomadura rugatobispora]